jgi:hypothetical protein
MEETERGEGMERRKMRKNGKFGGTETAEEVG